MLAAGASALDAVTEAVRCWGVPCYLTPVLARYFPRYRYELDACVMDGCRLQAGAVAGVQHLRNPVLAAPGTGTEPARAVDWRGAEAFAATHGMERR